ncbi:MAG: anaerobic ribonucleoside-triphosphate reductase activating protein [Dysgonamonadaceae bacterium]|jgi:anaerobic ribonucleoside-triphosphate reductase activating protein|nr:anaerobic ribonucleoside-triphosphate reductase activating protein [Dysgonamonadaceae bacterium]
MLRLANYDIVFQEIPGETTLALNLSNCPNCCKGCHSPHLMEDKGEVLNEKTLSGLLEKYGQAVTCICFMGGDASPQEINHLADFIRQRTQNKLKTAWYSGKQHFPKECFLRNFDYLKLGPYIEELGGLTSSETNQRFYRIANGKMIDETFRFKKESISENQAILCEQ